ncbi:hypothetical protein ABZV75_38870 [Streptomyces flaveolus]|uniref:hypothetical protein n=1 Tax=Streptomyces flaveolus TaxID=67297 RepID=UPI0033A0548F
MQGLFPSASAHRRVGCGTAPGSGAAFCKGPSLRAFGCLLYSLDKRESATYWWRFAAGAGDALAAHLLAAHHAATGPNADSRAWCVFSRMLGFRADRHVPQPVRHRTELAPNFAREIPMRQEARIFLRHPRLPTGLMTR